MDKFGRIVHEKRIKRGESLRKLARALRVSPGFASHIEHSFFVWISPRIIMGLCRHYRLPLSQLERAAALRNRSYVKYHEKRRRSAQ